MNGQSLFGTDGIRGVAGFPPLDPATIYRLARALVNMGWHSVLIGRDTRPSGLWIEQILQQAVRAANGDASLAKVMTTPGIAFLTTNLGFDAGIVVSASHNPSRDNGIKIFSRHGLKLSESEEQQLEEALATDKSPLPPLNTGESIFSSKITEFRPDLTSSYVAFLKEVVSPDLPPSRLGSLRVVIDCAHGATFAAAPEVFDDLDAETLLLNRDSNGYNINENCGAVYPESMRQMVLRTGASLGVAFDGDGDRAIFCDEKGAILDGDDILWILARNMCEKGDLPTGTVVGTIMTNLGLEVALSSENLRLVRTPVGDWHVLNRMLQEDHTLGGETSGHIIMKEYSKSGDGILTALKIAQIMVEKQRPLSDLRRGLHKFPQVIMNVPVAEKCDFTEIAEIQRQIEASRAALGDRGRVVVRYSGTEPVVRIMLEGEKEATVRSHAERIAARFHERLGQPEPLRQTAP